MLYTQETCLYPRLNAALRNHDNRSLEPFLPYMKLLLSGLYQLPLVQVPTYRGVKLELFEVGHIIAFRCGKRCTLFNVVHRMQYVSEVPAHTYSTYVCKARIMQS